MNHVGNGCRIFLGLVLSVSIVAQAQEDPDRRELQLTNDCIISVLNRTVQVSEIGAFVLPNVPANTGSVRARASCIREGETVTGETDYFSVVTSGAQHVGKFYLGEEQAPISLVINNGSSMRFFAAGLSRSISILATFADGTVAQLDLSQPGHGANLSTSNPFIASVNEAGVITSNYSGETLLTVRKNGLVATMLVEVIADGDTDGDGLPDVFEMEQGLNPSDPIDALEDADHDALSNLDEFRLGTSLWHRDSDGDDISDTEEVVAGADGYSTNPLAWDTDGDGISDGLEITLGFNPTDRSSGSIAQALGHIEVVPGDLFLVYNSIDGETSHQLKVVGHMLDGRRLDITSKSRGTSYASSDLSVASFGAKDGEIFAGATGQASIRIGNGTKSAEIEVTVDQFDPIAISSIDIPGYANNVDVQGNYAYVAAGSAGLQVVDVTNRAAPNIIASLETEGIAVDVKLHGQFAYVADGEGGVVIVDISEPSSPVLANIVDTSGFAQDMAISGNHLFVADGDKGVRIYYIEDPAHVFEVGATTSLGFARAVDVENGYLVVISNSQLGLFDIESIGSPILIDTVNVVSPSNLTMSRGFVYVASYLEGWKSFKVDLPGTLSLIGGRFDFRPRDVVATDGFTFWAERLFGRATAYVNIKNPSSPFFQGIIALTAGRDFYSGTGIAADSSYVYLTEEYESFRDNFGSSGVTKLVIAQYRRVKDTLGIAPEIVLTQPTDGSAWKDGEQINISVDAKDDVGVARVDFYEGQQRIGIDTTYPYSITHVVPRQETVEISAVAYDFSGLNARSSKLTVSIWFDDDKDGLSNRDELSVWLTDPETPDTDGDGVPDGEEVVRGIDPTKADTDNDGVDDGSEIRSDTDPRNPDRTSPIVMHASPADGDANVAEDMQVKVQFNEAIRLTSISASAIQVLENGSDLVAGKITLMPGQSEVVFAPDRPLNSLTSYSIIVQTVKDLAGNTMEPFFSRFNTGNNIGLDTTPPRIKLFSPQNSWSSTPTVPTNAVITAELTERVDPATVTAGSFFLYNTTSNTRVDGTISLSADTRIIRFTPSRPLLVARDYVAFLTGDIKDFAGNALVADVNTYFRTSFDPDLKSPEVIATTVLNDWLEVPLNVRLNVLFDEAVRATSISRITLFNGGVAVDVNRTISEDSRKVTLSPQLLLKPGSEYVLSIDLVEDLSGNILLREKTIRFKTGSASDTAGQYDVEGWTPQGGWESRIPNNARLQVHLKERVDPVSVIGRSFYLLDTTTYRPVPGSTSISDDGRTLTFLPSQALLPNRRYSLNTGYSYSWMGGGLTDLAGNSNSSGQATYYIVTESVDNLSPFVESMNIADGAQNVAINSKIIIALNEQVSTLGCLTPDSIILMQGTQAVPARFSFGEGGKTLVIEPETELTAFAQYQVSIRDLCDYAGNTLATTTTVQFSTGGGQDHDPPVLTSSLPVDGSENASGVSEISLTFNEEISPASQVFVNHSSGQYLNNLVPGSAKVAGSTLTFVPDQPLIASSYNIYARNGSLTDVAGNAYVNGHPSYSHLIYFVVSAPSEDVMPSIIGLSPEAGSLDINPDTSVVVTFSEPMFWAWGEHTIAFFAEGKVYPATVAVSLDRRSATVTGMPAASVVSLVINGAKDLSGNVMEPYVATFTTSADSSILFEAWRPNISRAYPSAGSDIHEPINQIFLYADEVLDGTTVQDALRVAEAGVEVKGVIDLIAGGRIIRFTKPDPFRTGTRVDFMVNSKARDLNGNPLFNWSSFFHTGVYGHGDGSGWGPRPVGYFPESGSANLPQNTKFYILFSEEIDTSSLDGNILLQDSTGSSVAVNSELDPTNPRLVVVSPLALLNSDETYKLTVLQSLTDTDGDSLYNDYESSFETGSDWVDNRKPLVVAMIPEDGSTNVAMNAQFMVRYDEPVNPLLYVREDSRFNSWFSENNTVLSLVPKWHLEADTEYAEISPLLPDFAGNLPDPVQAAFVTGAELDHKRLEVLESTLNSSGYSSTPVTVSANTVFEWYFNKPIAPGSVSQNRIGIRSSSSCCGFLEADVNISSDSRRIYLTPKAPLPSGEYEIVLGGLTDSNGFNSFTGFYRLYSIGDDFTPPKLENTNLVYGQLDVARNVQFRARFNEPINPMTLHKAILTDEQGAVIPISVTGEEGGKLMKVIPKVILDAYTEYTLNISGLEDIGRNAVVETEIRFTTSTGADLEGGKISWWSIKDEAVQVPTNGVIRLRFDEPVDITSLSVGPGNTSIRIVDRTFSPPSTGSSAYELSGDRRTLTVRRNGGLAANRTYDVLIGDGGGYWQFATQNIFDLAGNKMQTYTGLTFTTGSGPDDIPPSVVQVSVPDGSVDVPRNAPITILFNEPISAMCDIRKSVSLFAHELEHPVSATLTYDQKGVVVQPSLLAANTSYSLRVSGLCDVAGNRMMYQQVSEFTTSSQ